MARLHRKLNIWIRQRRRVLQLLNISQKREVFHRALLSSGLVKRLATPRTEEEGERYMIMVQGEPLSKTILQERR